MESIRGRIFIASGVIFLALIMLAPNFIDTKNIWWPSKTKLTYGLDIQGGVQLVLGVDTDSVFKEKAKRLALSFKRDLATEGVTLDDAATTGEKGIELLLKYKPDTVTRDRIRKFVSDNYSTQLQVLQETEGQSLLRFLDNYQQETTHTIVGQAIEVIRNRIDEFGVSEPSIAAQGATRILVQLPGIQDSARAKSLINRTAKLDFKLVSKDMAMDKVAGLVAEAERAGNYALGKDNMRYTQYLARINQDLVGKLPPKSEIAFQKAENATTLEAGKFPVLLSDEYIVGGDLLDGARSSYDQYGKPNVQFSFGVEGARQFGELTGKNVGRQLAIVLDGVVQSAPRINSQITTSGVIELGGRDVKDAKAEADLISMTLRAGALPAALEQLEERTVGPSLGADAIHQASMAGIIGFLLILGFMIFWYRGLGLVANLSLVVYVLLTLAALTSLGATLTLPGVAGLILSIGMAVDANIIIFERINDELKKGTGIKMAIKEGFANAFSAIFDGNITTISAAAALFYFGTGPVKGFAVTLTAGILISMFTAIYFSRLVIDILTNWFGMKHIKTW